MLSRLTHLEYRVLSSGKIKPYAHYVDIDIKEKTFNTSPVPAKALKSAPFIPVNAVVTPPLNVEVEIKSRSSVVGFSPSGESHFPWPSYLPYPKGNYSPSGIPLNCPHCGTPLASKGLTLQCPASSTCPAQRGDINTVRKAHPELRVCFPFWTSDPARFVHACYQFGCLTIPVKSDKLFDFWVLAPHETIFAAIGFYFGLTQWWITRPETIPVTDIIQKLHEENPILKYYH